MYICIWIVHISVCAFVVVSVLLVVLKASALKTKHTHYFTTTLRHNTFLFLGRNSWNTQSISRQANKPHIEVVKGDYIHNEHDYWGWILSKLRQNCEYTDNLATWNFNSFKLVCAYTNLCNVASLIISKLNWYTFLHM